ncbi:MAG: pantetheine-phosphate adenylyltransferase [Sphingobacteriia bacterium]|nr:pantetheine-phosphate adenylyltransferase [Sphingobacteriia bacterium]
MSKLAVFPGSFDPITIGHYSIINRALPLFDKIIIAIGYNREKAGFFPIEDRIALISKLFVDHAIIEVQSYTGLTVDFCKKVEARYLIRGLRTSADFEFERSVAQVNRKLLTDVETIFFLTEPQHSFISSSIVREIISHGGDPKEFLPPGLDISDLTSQKR